MATAKAVKKPTTKVKVRTKVAAVVEPTPGRRRVIADALPNHSNYFASGGNKDLPWVNSGCALFDEVLGGGYVLGRMVNIVGDKSSGKTLLAIEACANFHRMYPKGRIRYAEAESAFDEQYAEALGMPTKAVEFAANVFTVEDFFNDIQTMIKEQKGQPGLYILDSLDALSDEAEQKRGIDEGSYGGSKPKKLGELFRRSVQIMEESNILLIIISQIRDKIGVTFGETKTRSGGKAMDFYASQIIWLAEIGKLKKTIGGVDRVIGVQVKAKCKKNKVGLAFRECEYPILFGYGIDDLTACAEWLLEVAPEQLESLGFSKNGYKVRLSNLRNKGGEEVTNIRKKLTDMVRKEWRRIEISFLPQCKKY